MLSPLKHFQYGTNFLFVPSTRPERFVKAIESGTDGVILDLEDSVSEGEKEVARNLIRMAWASLTEEHKGRIAIRSNASGSKHFHDDLLLVNELGIKCLMIPKSESADQINGVMQLLGDVSILPLIETGLGIDSAKSIAKCSGVLRLFLGNIDLQADLGMVCDLQETELQSARFQIVLASRLAQIVPPVDGVTPSTDDVDRISGDAKRAKRMGFSGKLCIHPKQVGLVRAAFMPTEEEIIWAKRVIKADQESNGGAVKLDGKMIDRPVVLLAKRTLAVVN